MAEGELQRISQGDPAAMLDLWEAALGESPARQGLALLAVARPGAAGEEMDALPIGARDAELLDLHDRLFGSGIGCRTLCSACGETGELRLETGDLRATAAARGTVYDVELDGIAVKARLPDSRDLIAIEPLRDPEEAWQTLVRRCVVSARRGGDSVATSDLPRALLERVEAAASEVDPQADILLELVCPACGGAELLPFDIARQAWARLDHWARAMLAAVDTIAGRYGWTEAEILALGPKRRQHYLDLIGGTAQ